MRADDEGGDIEVVVSADDRDVELELYTAEARRSLLEEALGVRVSFSLS